MANEVSSESFDETSVSQVGSAVSEEIEREIFRTDEETCTFGIITAKGEYKPKSNFTMRLESFVDAGASTGYFVWIKRKSDGQEKLCYYTVESLMFKQRFLSEIRNTFKSGGFTCAFTERELTEFHNFLEKNFSFNAEGKMKQGVICVGKQPGSSETSSNMWILNQNVHINELGVCVPVNESDFAWQPVGGPHIELVAGRNGSITVELCSEIKLPLESRESLKHLLQMMSTLLKHNFVAGVLSVASAIMALHYQDILSMNSSCLIPFLFGETETGKSTAVKCALSICGQHEVSHLMKTKATSDSLCMERIKKSTLPFSLDDPKNLEDIGELLIQLCNGHLSGNLRVGLHKPRSIPLICCNFPPSSIKRYSSRALLIPFKNPSVGPQNEAESCAFDGMTATLSSSSAAVGWAISLGAAMKSEMLYIKGDLFTRVKERLPGVESRLVTGYAMCLFFAEKLVMEADFSYLKEELEEFLEENVKKLLLPDVCQIDSKSNTSLKHSIVWNAISEVIEWAKEVKKQGLFKVLQSVRTGLSYQGRKVLAIVWDDASDKLSASSVVIREAIRTSGVGVNHVSRDFVPKNSTNCNVKRGVNSYSRKCSVVWIDIMPKDLAHKAEQVTTITDETAQIRPDENINLEDCYVEDPDGNDFLELCNQRVTLEPIATEDNESTDAELGKGDDAILEPTTSNNLEGKNLLEHYNQRVTMEPVGDNKSTDAELGKGDDAILEPTTSNNLEGKNLLEHNNQRVTMEPVGDNKSTDAELGKGDDAILEPTTSNNLEGKNLLEHNNQRVTMEPVGDNKSTDAELGKGDDVILEPNKQTPDGDPKGKDLLEHYNQRVTMEPTEDNKPMDAELGKGDGAILEPNKQTPNGDPEGKNLLENYNQTVNAESGKGKQTSDGDLKGKSLPVENKLTGTETGEVDDDDVILVPPVSDKERNEEVPRLLGKREHPDGDRSTRSTRSKTSTLKSWKKTLDSKKPLD